MVKGRRTRGKSRPNRITHPAPVVQSLRHPGGDSPAALPSNSQMWVPHSVLVM